LVWAEHCGRVCVADARSNFTRRQIVDVLVEKEDLIEAEGGSQRYLVGMG